MITIKEVKTKSDIKKFVDFPTKLYKGSKVFVHPMRMDEIGLFDKDKNASYEDCDAIYFLAMDDKKVVGRIAGIIQKAYNIKTEQKRVRFSRFDSIDDVDVAKALFGAVESWAKESGMTVIHGPMGFNDLDREGMLIDGFEHISTFEEQYNFEYYPKLVEACGYQKEVDWLEFKIFKPMKIDERILRLSEKVLERYELKVVEAKNKSKFIKQYGKEIFEVIDDAYSPLYGTIPLSEKVREQLIDQFRLFIDLKFMVTVVDKNDRVVAFGFAFPSLSKAMNKSQGKLMPFGIWRLLKALKNPSVMDLALVGIRQEYQGKGLNAIIMKFMMERMIEYDVDYCETNLNLEDNIKIQQQWESFPHEQHKRRRSFVKQIN
ncbi:MAG: hypothetical protein RR400_01175 [Clostridia bacterium]